MDAAADSVWLHASTGSATLGPEREDRSSVDANGRKVNCLARTKFCACRCAESALAIAVRPTIVEGSAFSTNKE